MSATMETIKRLKRRYEAGWLAIPEVVAVGIGQTSAGAPGLIVSVRNSPEKVRQTIPEKVEGVPVEIQVTGEIKAF